jgi:hypothetical protein
MIFPPIASTINGKQCFFSKRHVDAFHLVYDKDGRVLGMTKGKMEVGTIHNLFISTEAHEVLSEINDKGLFLVGESQVDESLLFVFGL